MIVDDREHDLIDRLTAIQATFEVQRLPLGDIIIEYNGTRCIIERKRTDDFAASTASSEQPEQGPKFLPKSTISSPPIVGKRLAGARFPQASVSENDAMATMSNETAKLTAAMGVIESVNAVVTYL